MRDEQHATLDAGFKLARKFQLGNELGHRKQSVGDRHPGRHPHFRERSVDEVAQVHQAAVEDAAVAPVNPTEPSLMTDSANVRGTELGAQPCAK